jgi:hypothetical protein
MQTDEFLIEKAIKLFESTTGWGDSDDWTNQDFVVLSEKIQARTGVMLSHVTLKRVWGKVKYDSIPNTHTLDTLVQFLDYENWRQFKSQNGNGAIVVETLNGNNHNGHHAPFLHPVKKTFGYLKIVIPVTIAGLTAVFLIFASKSNNKTKVKINNNDYAFSSKKVVSEGVPNSVVFSYDATKAPYDSVIIQQSWDKHLQVKVAKNQHQHTSIYYYPDYYKAKLIVGDSIVSTHKLLIKSDGWLPIVTQLPVPVYFDKKDAVLNGKMALSLEKIQARNIKMQPDPPFVLYSNVKDFGEIYADDFTFETSLKNDYREGTAICQQTKIFLLCEGTAIGIPLCTKGCISDLDMFFTDYYVSGKQYDLSGFGVDFSSFVKVRIESKNKVANIFINDKFVYKVDEYISRSKIIGIEYSFQGTGSVDYVKLTNGKINYEDNF